MNNIKPDLLTMLHLPLRNPFHSNGFDEGCLQLILCLRMRRWKSDEGCLRHFSTLRVFGRCLGFLEKPTSLLKMSVFQIYHLF